MNTKAEAPQAHTDLKQDMPQAAIEKRAPVSQTETPQETFNAAQKTTQPREQTDTGLKDAFDKKWRRQEKIEKTPSPGDRIIDNFHAQTDMHTMDTQAPSATQAAHTTHEDVTQYVQKVCDRIMLSQGDGANDVSMRFTLSQNTLPNTDLAVKRMPDGSMQFAFETENPESLAFLKTHTDALAQHIGKYTQMSVAVSLNGQDARADAASLSFVPQDEDAPSARFNEDERDRQNRQRQEDDTLEEEDA